MNERLVRIRHLLHDENLDGILVTSPANRFYLSGFLSNDDGGQTTAALLVGREAATLMTGSTNFDWARGSARGVSVREWSRPWPSYVATFIRESGLGRVGFEDAALTVAAYQSLASELGKATTLVPLGTRADRLRRTKDVAETEHMATVINLTDRAFVDALADLVPGMTEREFAWQIDRALREQGADGSAFETIVASGPNASRPHHAPSERVIQGGEPVIVDMGAKLGGYNGDLTRTVWVGDADERLREVVSIVAAAHEAAWETVVPGAAAEDVHKAAESVARNAGYGENFLHGTGHGLGIAVHEAPSCGPSSSDVLQVGDLLTIEPGIYIPGWGGVRIEDVGVIEEAGFRRLTAAAKRLGA